MLAHNKPSVHSGVYATSLDRNSWLMQLPILIANRRWPIARCPLPVAKWKCKCGKCGHNYCNELFDWHLLGHYAYATWRHAGAAFWFRFHFHIFIFYLISFESNWPNGGQLPVAMSVANHIAFWPGICNLRTCVCGVWVCWPDH